MHSFKLGMLISFTWEERTTSCRKNIGQFAPVGSVESESSKDSCIVWNSKLQGIVVAVHKDILCMFKAQTRIIIGTLGLADQFLEQVMCGPSHGDPQVVITSFIRSSFLAFMRFQFASDSYSKKDHNLVPGRRFKTSTCKVDKSVRRLHV